MEDQERMTGPWNIILPDFTNLQNQGRVKSRLLA
jgi:hypothetical protein